MSDVSPQSVNDPEDQKADLAAIQELIRIMQALRDPDSGCPWDIRQNFESIAPFTIEEAYEVADAIERGDMADLKDELGDLLLQVVYHARMAEEQGLFDVHDVAAGINRKLVRRHPHVFGERAGSITEAEVKASWERIKSEERAEKYRERERLAARGGATMAKEFVKTDTRPSALDGIASNLPALSRAEKVQKRAARVGFDWPDSGPVWDAVQGELSELAEAVEQKTAEQETAAGGVDPITDELGDVLFSVVNLARHLGVSPEEALREATLKFERRFRRVEELAADKGVDIQGAELDALDALWRDAKRAD